MVSGSAGCGGVEFGGSWIMDIILVRIISHRGCIGRVLRGECVKGEGLYVMRCRSS